MGYECALRRDLGDRSVEMGEISKITRARQKEDDRLGKRLKKQGGEGKKRKRSSQNAISSMRQNCPMIAMCLGGKRPASTGNHDRGGKK